MAQIYYAYPGIYAPKQKILWRCVRKTSLFWQWAIKLNKHENEVETIQLAHASKEPEAQIASQNEATEMVVLDPCFDPDSKTKPNI